MSEEFSADQTTKVEEESQNEGLLENSENKEKSALSAKAHTYSFQFVHDRFNLKQLDLGQKKKIFYVQAPSSAFDRIYRRMPSEVNKTASEYVVPLGHTCVETVVNAYGLSNSEIYEKREWLKLISDFNILQTAENAEKVMHYLRSASYIKYLAVSGQRVNVSNQYDFITAIKSVVPYEVVFYFLEMIR